jgi:signal transduction histidine kinase
VPGIARLRSHGGAAAAATAASATARQAWHGLVAVLFGPDPAAPWERLAPSQRRAAYTTTGLAALTLGVVNVMTVHVASRYGLQWAGLPRQLLAAAVVVPLLLAARSPMLAWRIAWTGLLLTPLVPSSWPGGWPWGGSQIIATLAVFCMAGLRQPRPVLAWMWALTLIPWLVWLVADVPNIKGPVAATIVFSVIVIAVDSIGARLGAERALTSQAKQTEAERAQRAVLEERTRIARELHDVVAHHMSLVAVRAETAPYRLAGLPDPIRAEFASLSEVAREALSDMRRLLGVLRSDEPAALAPQPQLADLPALVDAARQAGATVELSLPAALDQVPSAVGVCAYRIVQESLSNAGQHAPGTTVTVLVDRGAATVVLRVANELPAGSAGDVRGKGHGLTGMRERVELLGGSLSAGPTPGGCFVVSAVLPLGEPDAVTASDSAGIPS